MLDLSQMERDRSSRRNVANSNLRSRHRQPLSLSIRTANYATPSATQQAPTPQSYPIPILQDKQKRALELYIEYCDAVFNEKAGASQEPQTAASHLDGYHLSVPGPPTTHSVTSHSSSRISVAYSNYDNKTDLSSVVSFGDEDEPTSAAGRAKGEMRSFDGKSVKQRRRKRLDPVARAKAALIRHLGSCSVCNFRRVKCPFEHHDIALLERLRQDLLAAERPRAGQHSISSILSLSQQTATSLSVWQETGPTGPGVSQTDDLMGIGANSDFDQALGGLGDLDTTQFDIQSSGDVAYGDDILSSIPAPALLHVATDLPNFGPSPYNTYQDGQMIAIGVHRSGYFWCQHLDELCLEFFSTSEQLQSHFETVHFAFTRIDPAHRFICSHCTHMNIDLISPCSNCFQVGTVELWICGNLIPIASFHPHAPELHSLASFAPDTVFSPTSYLTMNGPPWDQDLSHGNPGGYTNTGNNNFGGGGGSGSAFGGSQYDSAQHRTTRTTAPTGSDVAHILAPDNSPPGRYPYLIGTENPNRHLDPIDLSFFSSSFLLSS